MKLSQIIPTKHNNKNITLDFSSIRSIDSADIDILTQLYIKHKPSIQLINVNNDIFEILQLCHLTDFIDVRCI